MTPPTPLPADRSAPAASGNVSLDTLVRSAVSLTLLVLYFVYRNEANAWLSSLCQQLLGITPRPANVAVPLVVALLATEIMIWRRTLAREKKFHAPLLASCILLIGDAGFGILESHYSSFLANLTGGTIVRYSPTLVTIFTTVLTELVIGRFYFGKWPHVASAYVSGISAGILIKSNELWPFVLCGMISITSKYVLRIGERHIWNPTNLGVTLMLFLATDHVASLNVQAGNEVWSVLVIWFMGGLVLGQLKLLHISLAFVATFIPLSLFRAWWTGHPVLTELAPVTSPMFQLFIFFMITDPKTITKPRWSQILVAVLIAFTETFYRLAFRDKYSLYHSLFTIGPIASLIEIAYLAHKARSTSPATSSPSLLGRPEAALPQGTP